VSQQELWVSKDLVQYCSPGDVPHLAVSSTPEEWAQQGHFLFKKKRYLQAKHCFGRALLCREMDISDAYHLRERARSTPAGHRSDATRSAAFETAACAFAACGAKAKTVKEKNEYYRIAAECYSRSGDDSKAAELYENAAELTLATQHYRKAGLFDDAVRIIVTSPEDVDETVANQIRDVASLQWFRMHNLESVFDACYHPFPFHLLIYINRKAAKLFSSYDEMLEFTEDYDLDVAKASLLAAMGRISEAAQLHIAEGRVLDGIQLLLKDKGNVQHMEQAKDHLLRGLWDILSFGVSPEVATSDSNFSQLLDLTMQLNQDILAANDFDEVCRLAELSRSVTERSDMKAEMFRVIKSQNYSRLQELGVKFYHVHKNKVAALLCLDNAFTSPPAIQVSKMDETSRQLERFGVYVQLMKEVLSIPDPCNRPSLQKLFGFRISAEHVFLLRPGSLFHRYIPHSRIRFAGSSDDGITVYERDLQSFLKDILGERLHARVVSENEMCHRAQSFSPCLAYVVSGACYRASCPQEHISATALDLEWYNTRVRLHLQQIRIYHSLHSLPRLYNERQREQRYAVDSRLKTARRLTLVLDIGWSNCMMPSTRRSTNLGLLLIFHWHCVKTVALLLSRSGFAISCSRSQYPPRMLNDMPF
jgi:tetratricopeptide (TPR) repeat protein